MKFNYVVNAFLLLTLVLSGVQCTGQKTSDDQEKTKAAAANWQAMDDFHFLMAESFHPYKDSSNLEPAKANAAALLASAEKWVNSPIPERANTEKMKTTLTQLLAEANAYAETVKSSDDKAVAVELIKVHDRFHEVQELWYGPHEHKH